MIARLKKIKKIGKEGFTLIEILVAMSILSVGLLGLAGLATNAMKAASHAISMTQASNIAQDRLEALLTIDIANLNTTEATAGDLNLARTCTQIDATVSRPVWGCTPSATMWLDNREYTWSYTVTYIDLDGNGIAVLSRDGLVRVDLDVTWTDQLWTTQKTISMVALRGLE